MTKYQLASTSWDREEQTIMQKVIESGQFTMGKYVATFESDFAKYFGSRYAVMVNSGSSANLLMIAALFYTKEGKLNPGDEVIVPAVSWGTTYYPLHQYGLKLRFVDIDIETLNYDVQKLEKAITENTRLIMVVNLLGNPNDFDAIQSIIAGRNIKIIEDNCESMAAEYHGKKTGTIGELGSFSTFFSHHISTMEGGMVVTDNKELYHIMLSLRAHGWTRNLPESNKVCKKSSNPFIESYRFVLPGYNLRPTEISGAIGIEQLKKLPKMIDNRRNNSDYFMSIMSNYDDYFIQKEIGRSSWFGFSIIVKKGSAKTREDLINVLQKYEIEYRPIVGGNFLKNDVVKYMDYSISGDLTAAESIDINGIFLGNHHYDISEQLDILDKALKSI